MLITLLLPIGSRLCLSALPVTIIVSYFFDRSDIFIPHNSGALTPVSKSIMIMATSVGSGPGYRQDDGFNFM